MRAFAAATAAILVLQTPETSSFHINTRHLVPTGQRPPCPRSPTAIGAGNGGGDGGGVEEYRNGATEFLSKFMSGGPGEEEEADPLGDIDFDAPKARKTSLAGLAAKLDAELYEAEWFVTGRVNPIYFADEFQFQDPDVKLSGIEEYARGVRKIFDQTSRAQIISTVVSETVPDTITCTWRLSGRVNIGPGLDIKPYLCFTDLTVDPTTGLVTFQEDRFDVPGWDILLSALFPFLIGKLTAPPAPPVEPRTMPPSIGDKSGTDIFTALRERLGI